MSNKSIATIATMDIDIGKNSFRGAGGCLSPDSCRARRMLLTAESGQKRPCRFICASPPGWRLRQRAR